MAKAGEASCNAMHELPMGELLFLYYAMQGLCVKLLPASAGSHAVGSCLSQG